MMKGKMRFITGPRTCLMISYVFAVTHILFYQCGYLKISSTTNPYNENKSSLLSSRSMRSIIDSQSSSLSLSATTKSTSSSNFIDNKEEKTKICYGSQGTARQYWRLKYRFEKLFDKEEYTFYYHAYDRPCATSESAWCSHLMDGGRKTVPAEGRNIVIKSLVDSLTWNQCKYVVFFDDDAYLVPYTYKQRLMEGSSNNDQDGEESLEAWKTFHNHLLDSTTSYPIIAPQASKFDDHIPPQQHTYQSCIDEIFWAIRADHIDFVYPLSTLGRENYWLTNSVMFYVMEKCFPAGIFVDYRWYTFNEKHRYDAVVKDKINGKYEDFHHRNYWTRQILERDFGELGPWEITTNTYLKHGCTIQSSPTLKSVNTTCKRITEERFTKWINGDFIP